mmetsp:Transcript_5466/g.8999  ORF Transcript_5466/g.8999 Transcript_5466/m.8999 type:complete len:388 (-) Transcript_5466:28-1191(-)|eukprot:CAMPEP_0119015420 /NCGR_PEP_ID=MMETSP1176-20130426/10982_1 /TAXON_ID=265551 /ORGANISM="Synedropsis recta cf, Strain CCMP1620" /LENGTH=387 /DNA_ID=CAMNT_0006968711 /DNA_START=38 /DNA_END=1201 /DNA_ORIENTATION=+
MKLIHLPLFTLSFCLVASTTANVRGVPSESPDVTSAPLEPDSGSLVSRQFSEDPYLGQDKLELILSGRFMLADVHMSGDEEVIGYFCEFDFDRQQKDPSLAPRFIDLYGESRHCQEHHAALPLHHVAKASRERDAKGEMYSIDPSAFIFHQPKSGSALLTNMIAASQPGTRVISESSALGDILSCQNCNHEIKVQALQDAMYLLGRTTKDTHLYVKLSARNTVGLSVMRDSFPNTKWVFVYRDADTILQKLMNSKVERRICGTKNRRNPGKAMASYLVSKEKSVATLETDEQVCAAFLATNMATVVEEIGRDADLGLLVQYQDLVSKKATQELFEYLEVASPDWVRIEEQRKKRANNGRGQEWQGEADLSVSHDVRSATAEFELTTY